MVKLDVTWKRTLIIWWSLAWRSTLFGAIAGSVAGAIVGFILGYVGRGDLASIGGGIAGYLVAFPITIWILKNILSKQFKEFSLQLVAVDPSKEKDTKEDKNSLINQYSK